MWDVQAVGSRLAHSLDRSFWVGFDFEFGLSITYQNKRIDFVCSVRFSVFLYCIF